MSTDEIKTVQEYISSNDLFNKVEDQTKIKWKVGSRSTYYSAMKKANEGGELTLVESLMLDIARQVMDQHQAKILEVEAPAV